MRNLIAFLVLVACGKSAETSQGIIHAQCDDVTLGQIAATGYIGAAKNAARLAHDQPSQRASMCANADGSLRSLVAFLQGYNTFFTTLSRATKGNVVHARADSLLPNLVEAKIHCERDQPTALAALLTRLEQELTTSFGAQIAMCRERGWRPVDERLGK